MRLEDCENALRSFQLAIKKRPDLPGPWWGKGVCLVEEGGTGEAIASLKNASVLNPRFGPPHYALGLAYVAQGQRGLARQE
jgi:Flp pilus assembly protein TadD